MLVYGDTERIEAPAEKIARIRAALASAWATAGIERHAFLVSALIEAGELVQGLADHAFLAQGGIDDRCAKADAAMALTVEIARSVARSWSSGFAEDGAEGDAIGLALDAMAATPLPTCIGVKTAEGFAHYGLYPEAYLAAARMLATDASVQVIGIRSIGTTLAAAAAAALGAQSPPPTLRPVGHPFARTVSVAPAYATDLTQGATTHFAIVDEGPGLSGSSFAAVARFLTDSGVATDRIHILPSHGGDPGPKASPETRRLWARSRKHVRTFDDLVCETAAPAHRLSGWVADILGKPIGSPIDIAGGRWRHHRRGEAAREAPVHAWQERRKFLLRSESGTWLLKFTGLGRAGSAKYDRARALAEAGFSMTPAGWRHGFLIEPWHESARPLDLVGNKAGVVAHLGAYLGCRAKSFPSTADRGASLEALFTMARHNIEEALGADVAQRMGRWLPHLARIERGRRAVETDNRLHLWEWIEVDGRVLKTDALDHHAGHDLVGAQDIAWDVAGAVAEFGLTPGETERLADLVEREAGYGLERDLIAFYRPCYLAFQLGYYDLALADVGDPDEARRLASARRRYAELLLAHP